MTSFKIDKKDFKTFLKVCAMEGAIQFRDGKAVNKPFFTALNLIVEDGCIKILTRELHRKKTDALMTKEGVTVIESGEIPITSYDAIEKVLKGNGLKGELTITSNENGSILTIESNQGKDMYEIRQKISKELDDFKNDGEIKKGLANWLNWHKFDGENGLLMMHAVHPKTKQITDVPYPMRIKVKKEDLEKMVGDTINITKDNKTPLIVKNGIFTTKKGEANATIKSRHEIDFENLGTELIDFEEKFYSLQTIIPNLFDEIIFNIRRVKTNGTINMYITSTDEKSKISIAIGIASILSRQEKDEE